jgi:hypothetical protein
MSVVRRTADGRPHYCEDFREVFVTDDDAFAERCVNGCWQAARCNCGGLVRVTGLQAKGLLMTELVELWRFTDDPAMSAETKVKTLLAKKKIFETKDQLKLNNTTREYSTPLAIACGRELYGVGGAWFPKTLVARMALKLQVQRLPAVC